jgi:hypothetical protein
VAGTNFIAANLHCRFDLITVVSTFVSATSALCKAPAHWPALVSLEMSNNNFDFTNFNVTYLYQGMFVFVFAQNSATLHFRVDGVCLCGYAVDPEITGIYPSRGREYGGTSVTVFGNHFVNSSLLVCKFGTLAQAPPSVFWSSTKMECRSPSHIVSFVPREISLNGFEFTNNNTMFQYIRTYHHF